MIDTKTELPAASENPRLTPKFKRNNKVSKSGTAVEHHTFSK